MKKREILLHAKRVSRLLALTENESVNITIGATTQCGNIVTIEYDERDEKYIDWLEDRVEEV